MLAFQLFASTLCFIAAGLNAFRAWQWDCKRKALDKALRPVCQIVQGDNGNRQLGIFGSTLPEVGTTLYMLNKPSTKPAKDAFHA